MFVLESLKHAINWIKHGFKIIGQAENAFDAYEDIKQLRPDIVFTDIKMPEMDGLELMEKINTMNMGIQMIVCSGHADFTFAQSAMDNGAIAYCLKPFKEEMLLKALDKARANLEWNKSIIGARFFDFLQAQEMGMDYGFKGGFGSLKAVLDKYVQSKGIIVVSIGDGLPNIPSVSYDLNIKIGSKKWVYLISGIGIDLLMAYIKHNIPDNVLGIGLVMGMGDINKIRQEVDLAELSSYQFFIKGIGYVCNAEEIKPAVVYDNYFSSLDQIVQKKNHNALNEYFDRLMQQFKIGAFDIRHAFQLHNKAMDCVYPYHPAQTDFHIYNFEQLVSLFSTVYEMLEKLRSFIIGSFLGEVNSELKETDNRTLKAILEYVNNNFLKEDITVKSLADKFYLNPFYLGQLFKKEFNESFIQYLTRLRVSFACEMLKDTSLSINEVAEKAGYDNYFYFARIFKSLKGRTPSEYRNENI